MLSVIIPSRNEQYLAKTVDDLFAKAYGKIEVIVILDEKDQPLTPRPNLIVRKKVGKPGMKSAINQGVGLARGEYIMKTDAHCMFGEGFDAILSADCEDNWIVIPRRYSLDAETWTIRQYRPVNDYEFINFPWSLIESGGLVNAWRERSEARRELLIDEDMAFQGSCWLTTKKHFLNIGQFMVELSTGNFAILESWELSNKTWLSGGKVMINKKTWYAHLHKGKQYGRGYTLDKRTMRKQREFHNDYWMHDKWPKAIHEMSWLVERFMPIPGWPLDWQNPKYEKAYKEKHGL